MANSVHTNRTGAVWPLGFVAVPTPGTVVCLMVNIDANNTNAPGTASNTTTAEYTPVFRGLGVQAYKPSNNSMVVNTGNIYLMMRPTGNNTGNKSDTGAMIAVIPPGADFFLPIDPTGGMGHSPYSYFLDADNANDGGLVKGYQGMNP